VGFVYPAFQSWKALESAKAGEAAKAGGAPSQSQSAWLTYWVVFSLFNVVEHLADVLVSWCAAPLRRACDSRARRPHGAQATAGTRRRIPFYYIAKLAFVIWLQAPQTRVRARSPRAVPCCAARRFVCRPHLPPPRAQGASVLQVHYITPLLHKHENAIDSVLDDTIKKVRACTAASGYPGRDV
jgi:hypothetical protein